MEKNGTTKRARGGARTPEGKAASRYNATKHGLLCREVLLADEDGAELAELRTRLHAEMSPADTLEASLVDRVAANLWRLRRAMRVEREMLEKDLADDTLEMLGEPKTLGGAVSLDLSREDTYGKFARYEASIERGLYRALHELQRLQAARQGAAVLPPAAPDVDLGGEFVPQNGQS